MRVRVRVRVRVGVRVNVWVIVRNAWASEQAYDYVIRAISGVG